MSIFGPKACDDDTSGTRQDLTPQGMSTDFVRRTGDSMTGNLTMNSNMIRGLPKTYPPNYSGDEAPSWGQMVDFVQDFTANLEGPTRPSNVTTKRYVDHQDSLMVRKAGGTMTGNLDMGGKRVQNLPITPVDTSDACSAAFVIQEGLKIQEDTICRGGTKPMAGHLNMDNHYIKNALDPSQPQDVATKNYVDNRKPIITVWAEENGSLSAGDYEWSFGNGATGLDNGRSGYTMLASGRLLRMGVAVNSLRGVGTATVSPTINGSERRLHKVEKANGSFTGVRVFESPLELAQGDRLNFRSVVNSPNAKAAVVNALIELDL